MRLSKQPLPNSLKAPSGFQYTKTSDLLENRYFCFFKNPGLPYYPPLGKKIFDKIKNVIISEHKEKDALEIKIPGYMKKEILNYGEKINDTFKDKFVMLPDPMSQYMVLTTPEMEVLGYLSSDQMSYKNLPLKLLYSNQILRSIKKPKGILKAREFEVVMMLSVDKDQEGFQKSLSDYELVSEEIFNKLGISFKKCVNLNFDLEYFYLGNEGDNLELDNSGIRIKALSLCMGYQFKPKKNILNITSQKNRRLNPIIGTYGMGLERCFYAALDSCRDEFGFKLPQTLRLFDTSIIVGDSASNDLDIGNKLYDELRKMNIDVILDDRKNTPRVDKFKFSEYIGIPEKVIISKSGIRLKDREQKKEIKLDSLEQVVNYYKKD